MLPWGSTLVKRWTLERQDEDERGAPPGRFSDLPLTTFPTSTIWSMVTTIASNLPILVCCSRPHFQLSASNFQLTPVLANYTSLSGLLLRTDYCNDLPYHPSVFVSMSTSVYCLGSAYYPG